MNVTVSLSVDVSEEATTEPEGLMSCRSTSPAASEKIRFAVMTSPLFALKR